ncbi:MAG: DUF4932 domain-containing protein [Flavobacteriaceae bacterium]|nr:DUF4932 domain-containing protein [Flavobacteriaceae bacterium]
MKNVLKVLIMSIIVFSCSNKKTIPVIESNVKTIKYYVDGKYKPSWGINPKLKPDRLEVEADSKGVKVGFITDVDSIFFSIKEKDTIQFNIVLHKKDTALTEIVGIPKNVNFSNEYISLNKGKFAVRIPEIHELANIMIAICKIGQEDDNMIDMSTGYHKEVIEHFSPYMNHPAIDTLNNNITQAMHNESYYYYYALKMNACGYLFGENNEIIDDGIIRKMGFKGLQNPFDNNKELFEDFAKKSNFREFYKNHKDYYQGLVDTYKQLNPIGKMQNWLEGKFGFKYGNYLVTFSPLVSGIHSTQKYEDNGFSQTVMFVCSSEFSDEYNRNIDEMFSSRVVFTEIDHNFINPTTDRYIDKVNEVFKDRNKWADDSSAANAYGSTSAVFNEYMTFALFSIYCYDNFPDQDVKTYIPNMEKMMMEHRGFINFGKFNQELISVLEKQPNTTIDEMYIVMLEWSTKQ